MNNLQHKHDKWFGEHPKLEPTSNESMPGQTAAKNIVIIAILIFATVLFFLSCPRKDLTLPGHSKTSETLIITTKNQTE